ncbi:MULTISPECIES: patatin-like phospholipase family protein [unclassified Duganella]|uniref:patatin-like phospholipase family protein n=1 Tax=unclassified Duganella TaxID=2636909 RepID=UPI0006FBD4C6|nr:MULTISPECIES: patatin-like phospholipase family protein [unclassified Duganella]KQV59678.1 hypothetical protein ASD07_22895 [Duganella sp. Root336D2]KRB87160.1 hypothetical protein ASE26_07095 [Duganella sp. Root198D2]
MDGGNAPAAAGSELDDLVAERRKHLGENIPQPGRWGIALSGGGVRSATFCYGLIAALAANRQFWRFDLMSTVSGGGYIGAMLGRLAQAGDDAEALQKELAAGERSVLRKWLRANSRYLNPRGVGDLKSVVVTFLRNLLGIHLEIGMLGIMLGCALGAVDLLAWEAMNQLIWSRTGAGQQQALAIWDAVSQLPTIWLALVIPLLMAGCSVVMYWHRAGNSDDSLLTLAYSLAIVLLLLGAIDWIAWRIANNPRVLSVLGVGFVLLLPVFRVLMPLAQQATPGSYFARILNMSTLVDYGGRIGLVALAIFWTAVVHALATSQAWDSLTGQVDFGAAWAWLAGLACMAMVWVLFTGRHLQFLNRSSLHDFYRSRLIKAYLGACKNDIKLSDYEPHKHGGPVHLMNVCVNQTFQRKGAFNIDRQGELMTVVGPKHYRVGLEEWRQLKEGTEHSVGTWMAISGAAVAPGHGSGSSPGYAAMLTSLGIRLGYWWDSGGPRPGLASGAGLVPKYKYLLAELFGQLPGTEHVFQYLSDGGHCENTGVFPLLRERCKLIVLADCGADPEYRFDDLENLLRRARIDLGASIRFIRPDAELKQRGVGTLDDLVSDKCNACIALAQIDYGEQASDEKGVLVLVKPALMRDLPEDVHNYARDNDSFPQQSTADQFFAEDQWESYFSLGRYIGNYLSGEMLERVERLADSLPAAAAVPARPIDKDGQQDQAAASEPGDKEEDPGRSPVRLAVRRAAGATVGLGALLTAVSGVGMAFDKATPPGAGQDPDRDLLRPLYAAYADLKSGGSVDAERSAARLAAEVMYVWQSLEAGQQQELLKQPYAVAVIQDAALHCKPLQQTYPACHTLLTSDTACPRPLRSKTPVERSLGYWARYDPAVRDPDQIPNSLCEQAVLADATVSGGEAAPKSGAPYPPPAAPSGDASQGRQPASEVLETKPATQLCQGAQIFIQIYGNEGREKVRQLRDPWRAVGASVQPIEDVNASARRLARQPPSPVPEPTVIYHTDAMQACAKALGGLVQHPEWQVRQLSKVYTPTRNTIEVWLPPAAVKAGFDKPAARKEG